MELKIKKEMLIEGHHCAFFSKQQAEKITMSCTSTSPSAAINMFLDTDFEAFIFQSVLPDWFLPFGGRK